MSLIKPRTNRVRTVRHISRLQEPNRDALVQCARFIPARRCAPVIADSVHMVIHVDRRHGQRVVTELGRVCAYDADHDRFHLEPCVEHHGEAASRRTPSSSEPRCA
jgi:hypothetical protein